MREVLDRLPPQDREAEKQIIGSVLLDPRQLDRLGGLQSSDFYADAHRKLFVHCQAIHEQNRRIDATLVIERLRKHGDLEAVGGPAYVAECAQSGPLVSNAPHYAGIVRKHAQRRALLAVASDLTASAYSLGIEPEEALATAEGALQTIKTGAGDSEPVSLHQAVLDATARIDAMMERGKGAGILSGLPRFDETIGGFFAGELALVAARPGQGKTSLALQIAGHMAERYRRVYFATLEMDRVSLATKRLCSVAQVSQHRVRCGTLTAEDQRLLVAAMPDMPETLFLHDWPEIRPFDIARAARRLKADVIFVDYLQYVTPPDPRKKRYEQVGDISRGLKTVARVLNVPVIACAQIGRQADQQRESRPRLSHLRESGNIENDCDVACLLWRPDNGIVGKGDGPYAGDRWDAELDIAKNRLGQTARFHLDWLAEQTIFVDHATPTHAEFRDFQ